ncbi:VOC family protein [Pyxidicoccus caerfyrddinensis]|uniref:VOC family protein n=1 Tax=Pyxidicoccus caerfyrddinensis TaxID=2709663 RepID=UPI0013DB0387|nr:VOC family protein [Pyxidicoccus caerfyrddinensis]
MYDHIGLKVKNVAASVRFYEAALAPLGLVVSGQNAEGAGFGPPGAPALWLNKADATGASAHLAFRAATQDAVRAFHAGGLKAGGKDNGAAGPRPDYGPDYYAAFLIDPDGNNVEAVCMKAGG